MPTSAVIRGIPGLSPGRSLLGQSLPADSSARGYSLGRRESAGLLRSVGPFDAARGSPLVHRPCWLAPRVSEGTCSFPSSQDSNFCCRSAIPFFSRSTGFPSRWLQGFAWLLLCGCAGRNPDSATRDPAFSLCTPPALCLGAGQGEAMRSGLTSPAGIAPAWTNSWQRHLASAGSSSRIAALLSQRIARTRRKPV